MIRAEKRGEGLQNVITGVGASASMNSQQPQMTALGLRKNESQQLSRGGGEMQTSTLSPSLQNYFLQTDSGKGEAIAFSCAPLMTNGWSQ